MVLIPLFTFPWKITSFLPGFSFSFPHSNNVYYYVRAKIEGTKE